MTDKLKEVEARAETALGRRMVEEDVLSLPLLRRLAATINVDPSQYSNGDRLPPAWHLIFFVPLESSSRLGKDGHPATGGFLPDLGLPRRMFAGREFRFVSPLLIGEPIERETEIVAVTPKTGRSGPMAFVTVENRIRSNGELCLVERQTVVYREALADGGKATPAAEGRRESGFDWQAQITPDPPMLFRYSAVTFNAHRIHYDADYAREVEGYPGCLTNGGLTTMLLLAEAGRNGLGEIGRFSVRNLRPLFVDRPITLAGRRKENGEGMLLFALDRDGFLAAEADVTLAGAEAAEGEPR